jgi:hypothetical protein
MCDPNDRLRVVALTFADQDVLAGGSVGPTEQALY